MWFSFRAAWSSKSHWIFLFFRVKRLSSRISFVHFVILSRIFDKCPPRITGIRFIFHNLRNRDRFPPSLPFFAGPFISLSGALWDIEMMNPKGLLQKPALRFLTQIRNMKRIPATRVVNQYTMSIWTFEKTSLRTNSSIPGNNINIEV